MTQEHPTRIPAPTSGTSRTHTSIITFTAPAPSPPSSLSQILAPTRSHVENAYRVSTEEEAPASDQLLSLNEILAGPAPTPLERAMIRPLSCDFDQLVNVYDQDGGWSQRGLKKGGLSNLRIAHDASKFLGGDSCPPLPNKMQDEDDGEMWSEIEGVKAKEGYEGAVATLLSSFEEVAAMQGREEAGGMKTSWREKLGWKKSGGLEISWPMGDGIGATGAMAVVNDGAEILKSMAEQARLEGRDARVEQIALRVRDLVQNLSE